MADYFYRCISVPIRMITPELQKIIKDCRLRVEDKKDGIVTFADDQARYGQCH